MNITEIITRLDKRKNTGFQLSKRSGFLNSTWLIYKRNGYYYYFDVNQKIEFVDRYKYSKAELIAYFEYAWFEIDFAIS